MVCLTTKYAEEICTVIFSKIHIYVLFYWIQCFCFSFDSDGNILNKIKTINRLSNGD